MAKRSYTVTIGRYTEIVQCLEERDVRCAEPRHEASRERPRLSVKGGVENGTVLLGPCFELGCYHGLAGLEIWEKVVP